MTHWSDPVYARYLELARSVDGEGLSILKADCHNEATAVPPPRGIAPELRATVTLLEIDPRTVALCQKRHPDLDVRQGDVRDLPFEAEAFDAVLDLSTIDHVLPYDSARVLDEYVRVLRPGGRLVLVSWTKPEDEEHPGQTYHARGRLEQDIMRLFLVDSFECLIECPPDHEGAKLMAWVCRKES